MDYQIFEEISETELQETFEIFDALGITPNYAIKLFFDYVRKNKALPFSIET